jgi:flagellar M-ring protein FliF
LPGQRAAALEAPMNDKRMVDARELAKSNPAAVAHIVRDWVNTESA